MDNKNDWEELEKWEAERIEKQKEKYGAYYNEKFTKSKGVDNLVKGLNIVGVMFKIIKYVLIAIIIFAIFLFLDFSIPRVNS